MLWGKENLKCWFYSLLSSQGDLGMPSFGWDRKGTAQRWGLLLKMFLCLIFFLLLYMKLWNHPDFPFQRHTPARGPAAATAGMRAHMTPDFPGTQRGSRALTSSAWDVCLVRPSCDPSSPLSERRPVTRFIKRALHGAYKQSRVLAAQELSRNSKAMDSKLSLCSLVLQTGGSVLKLPPFLHLLSWACHGDRQYVNT